MMTRIAGSMAVVLIGISAGQALSQEAAREWVDPDTGHRIIRLSDEGGSRTLYFHQNSYTPEGDQGEQGDQGVKFVFNTPGAVAVVEITKLGQEPVKVETVVAGGQAVEMARQSREVYFTRGGGGRGGRGGRDNAGRGGARGEGAAAGESGAGLFAARVESKQVRRVANARGNEINCDETFSVASINAEDPTGNHPRPAPREIKPQMQRMFPGKTRDQLTPDQIFAAEKEDGLAQRLVNPASQAFVFTNLETGEQTTTGYQWAWLNHLQFSPTDPDLFMYCHEGTWHEVDRIWTIRTDGSEQKLMHKRTMDMEIAGHEFWSHDGKTIWFDLQTPRSQKFWIAGIELATGKQTRYPVEQNAWSVHYNISRDSTLFVGDGGDPTQVAFAPDGMWINIFRPQADGSLQREKLVNMGKHNYVTGRGGVEPNASITPDNKWVIFTGQFNGGERHVYAVEIAKAKQ